MLFKNVKFICQDRCFKKLVLALNPKLVHSWVEPNIRDYPKNLQKWALIV